MQVEDLLLPVAAEHADYLRDESRRTGKADRIAFPRSEEELRALLAAASARHMPVTTQGARTGITAGAVPDGGLILNLGRLTAVTGLRVDPATDTFYLSVQPGLTLTELRTALDKRLFDTQGWPDSDREALRRLQDAAPRFFPPDPTESSASLGGMVACNASGACSFHYGPTRQYVHRLRIALADGDRLELLRGRDRAAGRAFRLATGSGRTLTGSLPAYRMPAVKNASGFFAQDHMDLVDLFIGSEGTLGVITEIELRLVPAPPVQWGLTAFFPDRGAALRFVRRVRDVARAGPAPARPAPVAIEYFDRHALNLLRALRDSYPAFAGIPTMPPAWDTAVYLEFHGTDEEAVSEAVAATAADMTACGGSDEATWIASEAGELERFKKFRHSVPEGVNLRIDERRRQVPGLTKLGTDMAVPDAALETVVALYVDSLAKAGLEHVMFGHIGNNHLHVNILPRSLEEYEAGRALYLGWAREVLRLGGTVSAEHGIGKLKVALLREMYGETGIAQMRAVKRLFDPQELLNRGNLF